MDSVIKIVEMIFKMAYELYQQVLKEKGLSVDEARKVAWQAIDSPDRSFENWCKKYQNKQKKK